MAIRPRKPGVAVRHYVTHGSMPAPNAAIMRNTTALSHEQAHGSDKCAPVRQPMAARTGILPLLPLSGIVAGCLKQWW